MSTQVLEEETVERPPATSKPLQQARVAEEQDLREWLESLGGQGAVKVTIQRKTPKVYKGVNTAGTLETVEEIIDEDYLRDTHGGGTYLLRVQTLNTKGQWKYAMAKTVPIAGPPKIDALKLDEDEDDKEPAPAPSSAADPMASKAFDTMHQMMREATSRGGMDAELIRTMMAPLESQIRELSQANRDLAQRLEKKDERMLDLLNRKPEGPTFQDKILDKMLDSDNARIATLRDQHASELRELRTHYQAEEARLRDNFRDELKSREKAHDRELSNLEKAHTTAMDSLKMSYEMRIESLKSEIGRLQTEVQNLGGEVGTLRAKKDKSVIEQATELSQLRESLGSIFPDSSDDDDKKWYEKLMDVATNSPLLERVLGVGAPEQAAVPEAQQMLPPENVPFEAPDGNVYIRRGDQLHQVDPAKLQRQAAKQRARANRAQRQEAPKGPQPPSAEEIAIAVDFLEASVRNGTDAEKVAQTVRSLGVVTPELVEYLQAVGVDEFLASQAKLEPGSPLKTQAGRNFTRRVAELLIATAT